MAIIKHERGKKLKLRIVGSGGVAQIPNPFCECDICQEARIKRGRYERLGPSLYIEDIKMLIDTPEDIVVALDRQNISEIEHISISHKDPDHARGIRMVEPLGYNAITDEGHPVHFVLYPGVADDINRWNGGTLVYYEDVLHCISIDVADYTRIDDIELFLVNNKTHRGNMTFYVMVQNSKKAIYAVCDNKPFVENSLYYDADVLILGLVSDDGILKDGSKLENAPFKDDAHTLEEVIQLKEHYRIKTVIVTHIDEYWGKSYAYYSELEKTLDGILFAYDGMEILI